MRRAAAAAVAVSAAMLLTGCGERGEPVGTAVSPYPVTVPGADNRDVTLSAAPERIVALSAGMTAVVKDLGAGPKLVGSHLWDLPARDLPERVASLRPDLVVAPSTTPPALRDSLADAAEAPVYLMPDRTVHEIEAALIDLGLLTNRSVTARALIRADEAERARLARRLRGEPPVRVFVDGGFLTPLPSETLFSELLRIAGGRNVAGAHPEPGLFSLAKLAELDPQVYLATSDSDITLGALRSRKRALKISAVADGRFHRLQAGDLEPRGRLAPRLARLARLLHPDAGD